MVKRSGSPIQSTDKPKVEGGNISSRRGKRTLILFIGCFIVFILTIGGLMLFMMTRPLISPSEAEDIPFSVYSPSGEIDNFKFNKDRINYSSSTFSYIFEEVEGDSELTVTIQPKPDAFNMSSMSEGGSINSTSTRNGLLYNLSASGNAQYLLDTGESLVFLRSSKAIDNATMSELADNLVRIN